MQQDVWGAPARYATAWDAWQHVSQQTTTVPEDICTLLWFDHWGTYGNEYGQYGHVVTYVPGRGLLSNPGRGLGQLWYPSIEACERDCNAKFVGWSPDINGVQIASITSNTKSKGENEMLMIHKPSGDANVYRYAIFSGNFWLEFVGVDAANGFAKQIGAASVQVSNDFWNVCKASAQIVKK